MRDALGYIEEEAGHCHKIKKKCLKDLNIVSSTTKEIGSECFNKNECFSYVLFMRSLCGYVQSFPDSLYELV